MVALDAYDITADCHIIGSQIDSDTGGFEWSAPLIYFILIIPEDSTVGYFATGMEPILNGLQHTCAPHACQHIHIRSVGILEYGFISQ